MRTHHRYAILAALVLAALFVDQASVFAASPFGIGPSESGGYGFTGPLGGFFRWIAEWQTMFNRMLRGALLNLKQSGNAFWLLGGASFLYGIFHAAGPGHGKAVITSYLLVSRQTMRRGIMISFAAAFAQGATAIAIVIVATIILKATSIGMTKATDWFEIASYSLVALLGAWLLFAKLTGRDHCHAHSACGGAHDHHGSLAESHDDHDHDHAHSACGCSHDHHGSLAESHDDHDHDHAHSACGCSHDHHGSLAESHDEHDHDHAHSACGCSHAPDPKLLSAGPLTLGRAWSAILAVGVRPCSGALIILVFALSQHMLFAGIASVIAMSIGTAITVSTLVILTVSARDFALRFSKADSPMAARVVRGLEVGVAASVLLFGLSLLGGAVVGHGSF